MKEIDSGVWLVDTTDKNSFNCPGCGFLFKVIPRTINMEKLRHMQVVEKFSEWRTKHMKRGDGYASNVRLIVCPRCEQLFLCTDRFSKVSEKKP